MKKYIVLLFLAVLALPACNDMLDLRDNGTTDMSQVFSDRDKTRGYINACYNYVVGPQVRAGSFTGRLPGVASLPFDSLFPGAPPSARRSFPTEKSPKKNKYNIINMAYL